jgi:hypothetical protein
MKGWLMAPQVGLAMLLPVPSNACSGTAVVNMLDTRVEIEDAILNMGQPDALSPPKEEKAKQVLQSRSRSLGWDGAASLHFFYIFHHSKDEIVSHTVRCHGGGRTE